MSRLLLLLACGCGATIPPALVPGPVAGSIAAPELAESEVYVDLVLRTDAIQETLDREFPNPIHRERSSRLQAEALRGPLRLEPGDGGLLWTVPVEFWARASVGPLRFSCGVGARRPQVDVTLRTELRIDDAWSLATVTTAGRRRWSRRCRVSFLSIDVTSMIDPYVAEAQARAAREIDAQAANFDLASVLTQAWALSAIPLDLDAADPALRLGMQPVGLRVDALSGDATQLRLRLAVVGRFWIGPRIPFHVAGALPPPLESPAPPFVANFELPLELSEIQNALQLAMQGVTLEGAVVNGVELRVVDGGVAMSIQLSGASVANLWVTGTLLHEGGALKLGALRWSDATAAAIRDESFDELGATLFDSLRRWRHPVDGALGELRERAVAGFRALALNLDGVSVDANFEAPATGGVVFGDESGLFLRVPTPGRLIITVDAASVAGAF
ncbi:MAG: DUF4403 family protein [Polyangiales bacterium]